MPIIPRQFKATTDSYNWYFNYFGWPQLDDDTLDSAVVTATPSGLTLGTPTIVAETQRVYVLISGGVDTQKYRLRCVATTVDGQDLTGFLDLTVSDSDLSGVVIYPSQLIPYMDSREVMRLLYDDNELAEEVDAPAVTTIDGNARAIALSQQAWNHVLGAARKGNLYKYEELRDLAFDPIRGQDLISLVADLFWCQLIKRRRYPINEPQGKDPACETAEAYLEMLKKGERVFDLEGVQGTDGAGNLSGSTYTNELGPATTLQVGTVGSNCCHPERAFWGCTDTCGPGYRSRRRGFGCC